MVIEVKELDGRKWSDDATSGEVTRKFRITGLAIGFTPSWNYTGLPKVGDTHPSMTGFVVASREFEEGQGKDKQTVVVTVKYTPVTTETSGEGEDARTSQVDSWGWDEGTDERELIADVDGTPVLNSAGDPFESVPKISAPAPTFTKVMKFKNRQSGWGSCICKVNSSAVSIGGISFPIGSLLCMVSEERIIGDVNWKYKYTVRLKYKSNRVKIGGANAVTDIGWDVAVTDAGMRAKVTVGGEEKLKLIRKTDPETGKPCVVNSAALLDGSGAALADGGTPYNIRFKAYERVSFPNWFYSEPTAVEEGLD